MKGKIVLMHFPFTDLIVGEIGETDEEIRKEVNYKLMKILEI